MGWCIRKGGHTAFLYRTGPVDLKDRRGTAFHEAGHAVAALVLDIEVEWATIVPTEGGLTAGRFKWFPEKQKPDPRKRAIPLLAAAWAECLATNPPCFPRVVQTLGSDTPPGPHPFKYDYQARKLVRMFEAEITRVAEALLIRKRMTGYEIRCVARLSRTKHVR